MFGGLLRARPSPPPHRGRLPSGCSCRDDSLRSILCWTRCLLMFHMLQLLRQSPGSSWGRNRCCGGTIWTWNRSGTCWSHRCRNTRPADYSTWSWQVSPCPLVWEGQGNRSCIHQALASGTQDVEQELYQIDSGTGTRHPVHPLARASSQSNYW